MADLVEPAKSAALEELWKGELAPGIANSWLGIKMAPTESSEVDQSPRMGGD